MQHLSPIIFAGATMMALVCGGVIVVNAYAQPFATYTDIVATQTVEATQATPVASPVATP